MRFSNLAALAAMMLFVAYYGPIVVKLRDIPLTVVVLGGIALVAVDIWESLGDRSD